LVVLHFLVVASDFTVHGLEELIPVLLCRLAVGLARGRVLTELITTLLLDVVRGLLVRVSVHGAPSGCMV